VLGEGNKAAKVPKHKPALKYVSRDPGSAHADVGTSSGELHTWVATWPNYYHRFAARPEFGDVS
jgi:hypothetical protein